MRLVPSQRHLAHDHELGLGRSTPQRSQLSHYCHGVTAQPGPAIVIMGMWLAGPPLSHDHGAGVAAARTSATLTTSISGLCSWSSRSAAAWLSSSAPAHASPATRTAVPASAAARAVDSTQQSVETPASTSVPPPVLADRSGPHLPNVVAFSVGPGSPANSSTSS